MEANLLLVSLQLNRARVEQMPADALPIHLGKDHLIADFLHSALKTPGYFSAFLSLAQLDGSALRPATLGFRPYSYAADPASGWFGCGAITTDGCADEPVAKA